MNNFRWIAHLDTFAVIAQLHKLQPETWKGIEARGEIGDLRLPGRSLLLRGPKDPTFEEWTADLPNVDYPEFEKWKSIRRLINQARRAILADPVGAQLVDPTATLGRAMVSNLPPNGTILWHVDDGPYHARHVRFHVPLLTNPGALLYSGPESIHMAVGALWLFNNHILHSAANWGQHTRTHLIFELARPLAKPAIDD